MSEKYYSPEQKLIQAALTMDARAPSASHVLRKTIVARMVELSGCLFLHHQQDLCFISVSGFRDLVTGGAGGLLLLLPPNLQNDMEADAKEHILALEEELLNAELDIPIYFAEETEELLELYTTLTSEGEVGGLPNYNPEREDRSPFQEIS